MCIKYYIKRLAVFFILFPSIHYANAALIKPGDIAFTGWNADVNDAFSFVALAGINAGESIVFTDKEWGGSSFNSGEGIVTWTAGTSVAAGETISITDSNSSSKIQSSSGSVSGSIDLNVSNEGLFALLGSVASPSTFLAAFSSDGPTGFNTLAGTGLTLGLTAIDFNGTAGQDGDVFEYLGPRAGEAALFDYLALINDTRYWHFQGGSGAQHRDGLGPDVPFNQQIFTSKAVIVSEPPSLLLLFTLILVLTWWQMNKSWPIQQGLVAAR